MEMTTSAQRLQQFALGGNAGGGRFVLAHRVAAACFVVASLQLGSAAVEEQGSDRKIAARGEALDPLDRAGRVETAGARVKADGKRRASIELGRAGLGFKQTVQKADRKIVDRLPAHVLQRAQRSGLASTEHAGDEKNTLRRHV